MIPWLTCSVICASYPVSIDAIRVSETLVGSHRNRNARLSFTLQEIKGANIHNEPPKVDCGDNKPYGVMNADVILVHRHFAGLSALAEAGVCGTAGP